MFTEIIGNTDLYAAPACPCVIDCRELCILGCDADIPLLEVRVDELAMIYSLIDGDQN
jgi:hypothetical protein